MQQIILIYYKNENFSSDVLRMHQLEENMGQNQNGFLKLKFKKWNLCIFSEFLTENKNLFFWYTAIIPVYNYIFLITFKVYILIINIIIHISAIGVVHVNPHSLLGKKRHRKKKKKMWWWVCCFGFFNSSLREEQRLCHIHTFTRYPQACEMCPHCFVQLPDYCERFSPSESGCAHPCWARRGKGVSVLILITCCDTANAELVPSFLQKGALGHLKHLVSFKHLSLASCQQHILSIPMLFSCSAFKKQITVTNYQPVNLNCPLICN